MSGPYGEAGEWPDGSRAHALAMHKLAFCRTCPERAEKSEYRFSGLLISLTLLQGPTELVSVEA